MNTDDSLSESSAHKVVVLLKVAPVTVSIRTAWKSYEYAMVASVSGLILTST